MPNEGFVRAFKVSYNQGGAEPASIECRLAVARWGPEKFNLADEASPFRSVADVFDHPGEEFLGTLRRFLYDEEKHPSTCNQATLWERDDYFKKDLNRKLPPREPPILYAEFVQSFPPRDNANVVYRMRIWLEGVPKHLSVRYDLHPEKNKPITRFGIDDMHELWINTWGDYGIRVRTSDGFEWNVGTVLQALERWRALPQERGGPEPGRRIGGKLDDKTFPEETVDQALSRIVKQTARMPARNIHHSAVIQALQADGWTITLNPLLIPYGDRRLFINLGAEPVTIGAERGSERIAIEIASFVADSPMRDLQEAVGQFVVYRALLSQTEPDRALYLGVSRHVYDSVLSEPVGQLVAAEVRLRFLVFDPHQQKVVRWIS